MDLTSIGDLRFHLLTCVREFFLVSNVLGYFHGCIIIRKSHFVENCDDVNLFAE